MHRECPGRNLQNLTDQAFPVEALEPLTMLKPFAHPIGDIPVIAAIAGSKSDAGGRIYALTLHTLKPGGEAEIWQSLVRYQAF